MIYLRIELTYCLSILLYDLLKAGLQFIDFVVMQVFIKF